VQAAGAAGGNGVEFDPNHGAGGGGGGGGYLPAGDQNGGNGGFYGGGGGGTAFFPGSGLGGAGGSGLIVVTYSPASATSVTAEAWAAIEAEGVAYRSSASPTAFLGRISKPTALPTEWEGMVTRGADPSPTFQHSGGAIEFDARLATAAAPVAEILGTAVHRHRPGLESLANGTKISVAGRLVLEWTDPPGLPLVSPDRLLRSPGRIRILAGSGSLRPLKAR
jgi:hypothetical protein